MEPEWTLQSSAQGHTQWRHIRIPRSWTNMFSMDFGVPVFRVWVWCSPQRNQGLHPFTWFHWSAAVSNVLISGFFFPYRAADRQLMSADPSGGPWMKSDIHSTKDKDRERKDKEKAGPAMCLCQLPGATFRKTMNNIYTHIYNIYIYTRTYM